MMQSDISNGTTGPGTASSIFLLIDSAQYPGIWRILQYRFRRVSWISLSENGNDIESHPVLLHVDSNQTRTLAWFLEHTADLHCLSWLESPLALPDLAAHLRSLTRVEAEDGESYDIRFYDTRILPAWYQMLDTSQEASALGPIASWTYLGRDGMPCTLFGHARLDARACDMMKLTAAQERLLLEAALPDIVLKHLEQNGNADLAAMPRAQRYSFIADQVQKATTQYGIASIQELVLFCSLALGVGRNFDKLLPVAQVLKKFASAAAMAGRETAFPSLQGA